MATPEGKVHPRVEALVQQLKEIFKTLDKSNEDLKSKILVAENKLIVVNSGGAGLEQLQEVVSSVLPEVLAVVRDTRATLASQTKLLAALIDAVEAVGVTLHELETQVIELVIEQRRLELLHLLGDAVYQIARIGQRYVWPLDPVDLMPMTLKAMSKKPKDKAKGEEQRWSAFLRLLKINTEMDEEDLCHLDKYLRMLRYPSAHASDPEKSQAHASSLLDNLGDLVIDVHIEKTEKLLTFLASFSKSSMLFKADFTVDDMLEEMKQAQQEQQQPKERRLRKKQEDNTPSSDAVEELEPHPSKSISALVSIFFGKLISWRA